MSPPRWAGSIAKAGLVALVLEAACATPAPVGVDATAPRGKVITAQAIATPIAMARESPRGVG